jgi:hypothetical protein
MVIRNAHQLYVVANYIYTQHMHMQSCCVV